jgi:hypothetical protein
VVAIPPARTSAPRHPRTTVGRRGSLDLSPDDRTIVAPVGILESGHPAAALIHGRSIAPNAGDSSAVATSSKKPTDSRRVKIDELRAQQKAKERKRSMLFVGLAIIVGLGLIAAAAIPLLKRNADRNREISSFGVAAAAAGCGDIFDDAAEGVGDHVGPGTDTPDTLRVDYPTSPPSSGQHFISPLSFDRHFYSRDDIPVLENLVHNLEHGYTIVWYDESVSDDDVSTLEDLAARLSNDVPKFIVTAWDSEDRGAFPEGHIAFSHWTDGTGHRQYCERASGEAVQSFVTQFPSSDAPEPDAA